MPDETVNAVFIQEQAPPKPADGDMWLLVLKDMEERRQHGIKKYGVPVQPFNGRDPLIDAYQEALDLCVYLRQAIEERKPPTAEGMSVERARELSVCRICHEPIYLGGGPKDAPLEFGEMTYPQRTTFNFGDEFAHTDCLKKDSK